MGVKLLFTMFASLFISQQFLAGEITLSASLNTPVIQLYEETLLTEGKNRDWGGKFKITEARSIENILSIDDISVDNENRQMFDLTINLKNFKEKIVTFPKLDDVSSDYFADVENLYNIPIPVKFNGDMILDHSTSDEYLLYDLGLKFNFRTIFIPFGKELGVGTTFVQEFFIRPDDAAERYEDEGLTLEFNEESWRNDHAEEYRESNEPILLIKYTFTEITDSAVFADISGGLLTISPSPSMKPTFTINGKGIWQRDNPIVNEISYDFNYSEKRANSSMTVQGSRKTKSSLP